MLEAPPHGLKFILTTRVAPQALLRVQPGLQDSLELDQGLKSPYAENVLKAMDTSGTLGFNAPDAPLAEIREATRGFPRALEAVVGILRTDRSTDLRGLLKELQLLGSKAEDVVRDLVGEAFSRLDPLAQEVMQALAIYGVPVPAVAVDYLLQPYRVGIDSSKTLGRLVNMQFVRGEAGRFYLHQVDRDYAMSRLVVGEPADREVEPPPLTRYALRHRAAEYFKETRKPRDSWKSLEDLAPQFAEFDLRLAGEDNNAAASVLIEIDEGYLDMWGHYRSLADRYERLQGKLTDPYLEWASVHQLGSAYVRTGLFEKGLSCFEHCLDLARGQENKQLEANALTALGWVYSDMGGQAKAIDFTQQAIDLYEKLHDKSGEAIARGNLATSLHLLGQSPEAIEQLEKVITLEKGFGTKEAECRHTNNLADMYLELGENAKASKLAEDAREMARTIGYKLIEGAAMVLLGILLERENRLQDSIKAYEDARFIADEINAVQLQMNARQNLAWAYLFAGDIARARTIGEEAMKYRFPIGYASTLVVNGVVALRQGDTAAACNVFNRALSEADMQMASMARTEEAAYVKALALAALALCRDATLATAAAKAYQDARAISAAPGVLMVQLLRLDTLTVVDSTGTLIPVRAVAAGEA
jgi:tetratricopeptide (TPR) repeat protein